MILLKTNTLTLLTNYKCVPFSNINNYILYIKFPILSVPIHLSF